MSKYKYHVATKACTNDYQQSTVLVALAIIVMLSMALQNSHLSITNEASVEQIYQSIDSAL